MICGLVVSEQKKLQPLSDLVVQYGKYFQKPIHACLHRESWMPQVVVCDQSERYGQSGNLDDPRCRNKLYKCRRTMTRTSLSSVFTMNVPRHVYLYKLPACRRAKNFQCTVTYKSQTKHFGIHQHVFLEWGCFRSLNLTQSELEQSSSFISPLQQMHLQLKRIGYNLSTADIFFNGKGLVEGCKARLRLVESDMPASRVGV